jgi:hypothetical protein
MVKIGDEILICENVSATVTTLFQSAKDGRWVIGYRELKKGGIGFFVEGDEKYQIL